MRSPLVLLAVPLFLSLTACTEGAPGPQGPAGPRGAIGPTGAPGATYAPVVSTLSNASHDVPAGSPVDVRVSCATDMIAVGGGCSAHGIALATNTPDTVVPDAPDGWACAGTATDATNDVTVTVICLARQGGQ